MFAVLRCQRLAFISQMGLSEVFELLWCDRTHESALVVLQEDHLLCRVGFLEQFAKLLLFYTIVVSKGADTG